MGAYEMTPMISGRDTVICAGDQVDLSILIEGIYVELYYGTTFGDYPNPTGIVTPTTTTTYYIADSTVGAAIFDTTMITVTVHHQPTITGRDTSVCMDATVDLSTLIEGTPVNALEYGNVFGTYNVTSSVQVSISTTFYVRDSSAMTGCVDTALINVNVFTFMDCLMTFSSGNELAFADPCLCTQVVKDNGVLYLRDTLVVYGTQRQSMLFSDAGISDFYSTPGVLMADGTPFTEGPLGAYKLVFYKLSGAQAMGSVTLNGGSPMSIPLDALELCDVVVQCPELIPTLGQWGMISLCLLLLNLGVNAIRSLEFELSVDQKQG